MAQNSLPDWITQQWQALAPRARHLVWTTHTDLDLEGQPADEWLLVTESQLVVATCRGDEPHLLRNVPLSLCSEYRIDRVVGSAYLQGRVDSHWIDLVRFSTGRTEAVAETVARLNRLVRDAVPAAEMDAETAGPSKSETTSRWSLVGRVWDVVRPYRLAFGLMLGLSLFGVALELAPPILQQILVDDVLQAQADPTKIEHILVLLAGIVLALSLVRLIGAGLAIWKGALASKVGTGMTADLRTKLVRKLSDLPLAFHDRNQTGMLMSRVAYDTEAMHTLMHQLTNGFLLQILQLIAIGIMLFSLNSELAFYTLLPVPIVVLGSWMFTRHLHPRHHRYWDAVGRQAHALNGMLSGIRVVKSFTQEDREHGRFEVSSHRLRDSRLSLDVNSATFSALMGFVFGLGGLIVWYLGGYDVLTKGMTLGALMAFLAYLAMFYAPLTTLAEGTTWLSNFITAAQRIFALLDEPNKVVEPEQPVPVGRLKGLVTFDHVQFGYDPGQPVLKDVSFEIQPGQMVGIVGRSGSGKSTLVSLISRLYDATGGHVKLDGVDVRDIGSGDLRRQIGIVPQEAFLFEGTVENNILYGRPDANSADVLRAAKAANAHDFIMRMPFGYETVIGERGTGLSGGERQRLSIARALLYDPRVLILDEATASVDTESERAIQEAVKNFSRGRTTIAIAHRLSTLRDADRLLVFDQGRLVEQGSHNELVAQEGLYARLVRIQTSLGARQMHLQTVPGNDTDLAFSLSEEPETPNEDWNSESREEDAGQFQLRWLTPGQAKLSRGPHGLLQAEVGGQTYTNVAAVRAFPATHSERYISLHFTDEAGVRSEVGIIDNLADWSTDEQDMIRAALRRRYLLRTINRLERLRPSAGQVECTMQTEAGRQIVRLDPTEGVKRYGRTGRLLIDTTGNYYLLPCIDSMNRSERAVFDLYFGDRY